MKAPLVGAAVLLGLCGSAVGQTRNHVLVVGSSTLFPFATAAAEQFGRTTEFATPVVEGTGSGAGMRLFCNGIGLDTPDMVMMSRRIAASEVEQCASNGVSEIVEVKFGYDGLSLVNSVRGPSVDFALKDIFLAFAKQVPDPDEDGELVLNPYQRWSEVNPELPDVAIDAIGPSSVHGTRDAFNELAMEGGCRQVDWLAALRSEDRELFREVCHTIREDGRFIEASGSYNVIIARVDSDPDRFGIVGFNFVDQNRHLVQAARIEGYEATEDNVADGFYPLARSLYFYVKRAHIDMAPGLEEFVLHFVDERTVGEAGILIDRGLIPLDPENLRKVQADVKSMRPFDPAEL